MMEGIPEEARDKDELGLKTKQIGSGFDNAVDGI